MSADYAWLLTPLREAFGAEAITVETTDGEVWVKALDAASGRTTRFCVERPSRSVNAQLRTPGDRTEYIDGTLSALKEKIFLT